MPKDKPRRSNVTEICRRLNRSRQWFYDQRDGRTVVMVKRGRRYSYTEPATLVAGLHWEPIGKRGTRLTAAGLELLEGIVRKRNAA